MTVPARAIGTPQARSAHAVPAMARTLPSRMTDSLPGPNRFGPQIRLAERLDPLGGLQRPSRLLHRVRAPGQILTEQPPDPPDPGGHIVPVPFCRFVLEQPDGDGSSAL